MPTQPRPASAAPPAWLARASYCRSSACSCCPAEFVFPGATHTRFFHSLGVAHRAKVGQAGGCSVGPVLLLCSPCGMTCSAHKHSRRCFSAAPIGPALLRRSLRSGSRAGSRSWSCRMQICWCSRLQARQGGQRFPAAGPGTTPARMPACVLWHPDLPCPAVLCCASGALQACAMTWATAPSPIASSLSSCRTCCHRGRRGELRSAPAPRPAAHVCCRTAAAAAAPWVRVRLPVTGCTLRQPCCLHRAAPGWPRPLLRGAGNMSA